MTKIINNSYYNKTNVMNATIKTATNYFFISCALTEEGNALKLSKSE